jgi:hypothetical protein
MRKGRILQGNTRIAVGDGQGPNVRRKEEREGLLKTRLGTVFGGSSLLAQHLLQRGEIAVYVRRLIDRLVVFFVVDLVVFWFVFVVVVLVGGRSWASGRIALGALRHRESLESWSSLNLQWFVSPKATQLSRRELEEEEGCETPPLGMQRADLYVQRTRNQNEQKQKIPASHTSYPARNPNALAQRPSFRSKIGDRLVATHTSCHLLPCDLRDRGPGYGAPGPGQEDWEPLTQGRTFDVTKVEHGTRRAACLTRLGSWCKASHAAQRFCGGQCQNCAKGFRATCQGTPKLG